MLIVLIFPIADAVEETSDSQKFTTIEAETANLSDVSKAKIIPADQNNGVGCLELLNGNAVTVRYSINVINEGYYSIDFRYINKSIYELPMILSINGKKSFINFSSGAGDNSSFKTLSLNNVVLIKGENQIELATLADIFSKQGISIGTQEFSKGVWFDCMMIKEATLYEAEKAILTGGATVAGEHGGCTGSGFVAGYESKRASTKFEVVVPESGNYPVKLRYANGPHGGGGTKTLSLYVNSRKIKQVSMDNTMSWAIWSDKAETVYLNQGINTIEYRNDPGDTGFINIDHIIVSGK